MNCRLYCGHLDGTELVVKPAGIDFRAGFLLHEPARVNLKD
jgi:hypothetical protein